MTQTDLNRRVAEATGESTSTIASRGFSLLTTVPQSEEWDREPLVLDWDEVELRRGVLSSVP